MTEEKEKEQRVLLQRGLLQSLVTDGIALIRKQGGPAQEDIRKNGISKPTCRYRTSEGRKCFIGGLITDEAYSEKLEGMPVTNDAVIAALVASGYNFHGIFANQWGGEAHLIVSEMQQELHDSVQFDISISQPDPFFDTQWMIAFEQRAERWCSRIGFAFPANPL